jgi:hypothetical protein
MTQTKSLTSDEPKSEVIPETTPPKKTEGMRSTKRKSTPAVTNAKVDHGQNDWYENNKLSWERKKSANAKNFEIVPSNGDFEQIESLEGNQQDSKYKNDSCTNLNRTCDTLNTSKETGTEYSATGIVSKRPETHSSEQVSKNGIAKLPQIPKDSQLSPVQADSSPDTSIESIPVEKYLDNKPKPQPALSLPTLSRRNQQPLSRSTSAKEASNSYDE